MWVLGVWSCIIGSRQKYETILCLAVKYWLRILHMGRYELIRDRDDRKYKIPKLE
jgi:hypothetical protein